MIPLTTKSECDHLLANAQELKKLEAESVCVVTMDKFCSFKMAGFFRVYHDLINDSVDIKNVKW